MKCIQEKIINSRFSRVRILADTLPSSMIISAEDVDGVDNSRQFATGSKLYCVETKKVYMLGPGGEFKEVDAGGGGVEPTGTLEITENGEYDVSSYAEADVNVPGIVPAGTKAITSNGRHNVSDYEYANVNVPTGVFPSGTIQITQNGDYDITLYEGATVDVASVDGNMDALINGSITEIESNVDVVRMYAFYGLKYLEKLHLPEASFLEGYSCSSIGVKLESGEYVDFYAPLVQDMDTDVFYNARLGDVDFPILTRLPSETFKGSTLKTLNAPLVSLCAYDALAGITTLERVDFTDIASIMAGTFYNCTSLDTLIIRGGESGQIPALYGQNTYDGGFSTFYHTPIASGTGYIYVKDELVSEYQSATNWSRFASQIKGLSELPN